MLATSCVPLRANLARYLTQLIGITASAGLIYFYNLNTSHTRDRESRFPVVDDCDGCSAAAVEVSRGIGSRYPLPFQSG